MHRGKLVVLAAVALLLTGCGTAAPVETAAPAAATEPEPLVAETAEPDAPEAVFLAYVRDNLPANTQIPNATDEQLLAAGAEACARLDAGESGDTISLIEGEQPNAGGYYVESGAILTGARLSLCPEHISG